MPSAIVSVLFSEGWHRDSQTP